jgi:uncharacterized coiled-coil protein SlyX
LRSPRRHYTIPRVRGTASEAGKSLELETRVARTELVARELHETLTVLERRMQALQAQLDYIVARLPHY